MSEERARFDLVSEGEQGVRRESRREPLARGRFAWRVAIPLALMAGMAFVSHGEAPIGLPSGGDKLAHAAAYATLGGSWAWALATRPIPPIAVTLRSIALAAFWGVIDELHQSFVPGRDSSGADALADLVGATLGSLAMLWYLRRSRAAR